MTTPSPAPHAAGVIEFRAGMVFHVTRAASPQFVQPIFFRLIKVREDWITYHGWIWLHGYQLDAKGEAVAQRSIFVQPAGLIVQSPPPVPARRPQPAGSVVRPKQRQATSAAGNGAAQSAARR
ncbi:hypothetical protein [Micromonospora sp. KC207]|uniref:hypothetical protein n=1 Tax=Micromonospora sp. KC207 TaxID=2530377 RepID=UPI001A9D5619|nr:hypothetical protein [Micromonospora sp. KC207]